MPEEAGRLEERHPGTTGCADGQGTQTHISNEVEVCVSISG